MYGAILDRYKSLGGPTSALGFPTNDESDAGNGVARFNDFTAPGGASIYWSPEWGAMVVKGRVRDAWLASGGVNGPFSYPTADTATASDVQTGKFIGPAGTEIQWSNAAGLVTVPAALASSLPGFRGTAPTAEGTQPVTTTSVVNEPTASGSTTATKSTKWWWIPIGLAAVAALAGIIRLLTRRRRAEPEAAVAPTPTPGAAKEPALVDVSKVAEPPKVAPRVTAQPTKAAAPTAPKTQPTAPKATAPTAPKPQPAAPRNVVAPAAAPKPAVVKPLSVVKPVEVIKPAADKAPEPARVSHLVAEAPKPEAAPKVATPKVVHIESHAVTEAAIVKYENASPAAESTVQVTYENNAIGDDQESTADMSSKTRA